MSRKNNTAAAAPETAQGTSSGSAEQPSRQPPAAQEAQEQQDMSQDTQEQETASDAAESAQEAAEAAIDPNDPADMLSCQDEVTGEAELAEGLLVAYAVTARGGLRLREAPGMDSPIIAVLPWGAGVFWAGEPAPDGWCHVRTGRLEGWMLAEYLEALPHPELSYAAE